MKVNRILKGLPIVLISACLIGMPLLSACSSSESATVTDQAASKDPVYATQIFIDCRQNLFFSKYDVDVFVDGKEIGNVEHGSEATFQVDLTKGQHELSFEKESDYEPDGRTSFVVEGEDDKFSYQISCTSSQIEIESIKEEKSSDAESEEDNSDEKEAQQEEATKEKKPDAKEDDGNSSDEKETLKETSKKKSSDAESEEDNSDEKEAQQEEATKEKKPTTGSDSSAQATPNTEDMADVSLGQEITPSKYEYAYVRRMSNYDLYYLIDLDEMTATYFGTNDSGSMVLPCSGDLEGGLTVDFGDEGFVEYLRFKTPGDDSEIVLIDASGFDWEYTKTDAAEAEAVLASIS